MGALYEYFRRIAPKRFRGPRSQALWSQWIGAQDSQLDIGDQVAAAAMLDECPDSFLDKHLRNTGDWRMWGETDAAVRAYLRQRWTAYHEAGTPAAIYRQLKRNGIQSAAIVREIDLRKAGIIGAFGGNIGYWFLIIYQPHPLSSLQAGLWGDGRVWGDGSLWGAGLDGFIDALRAVVRRWKADGESCRFAIIADDNTFSYDFMTYTPSGNYTVYPISEAWEWIGGLHPYYSYDYATP